MPAALYSAPNGRTGRLSWIQMKPHGKKDPYSRNHATLENAVHLLTWTAVVSAALPALYPLYNQLF